MKKSITLSLVAVTSMVVGVFFYLRDRGDLIFIDPPAGLYDQKFIGKVELEDRSINHYSFVVRYKGDYPIYFRIENPPSDWLDKDGHVLLIADAPEISVKTVAGGQVVFDRVLQKSDWHISSAGSDMVKVGGVKTSGKNQKVDVYIKVNHLSDSFKKSHGKMTLWYQFYWG